MYLNILIQILKTKLLNYFYENIDNIFVVTKLKEIKSSELKEKETKKETSDEVKPKEEKQLTMSDFFEEFKIQLVYIFLFKEDV